MTFVHLYSVKQNASCINFDCYCVTNGTYVNKERWLKAVHPTNKPVGFLAENFYDE